MGSLTLLEMVNSVGARIDENAASASAVTGKTRPEIRRIVESLNAGYRIVFKRLYGSLRPQTLDAITVTPGNASYNLSATTNIFQTMYVYPLAAPRELVKQSNIVDLTEQFGSLLTQGSPEYWYRYRGKLSFYPVPALSAIYIVEGSIAFTELSVDTDTTFLPAEHDFLLQTYAIALEKAFWRDPDAAYWLDKFKSDLTDVHAEALRNAPTKAYAVDPYWSGTPPQTLTPQYTS